MKLPYLVIVTRRLPLLQGAGQKRKRKKRKAGQENGKDRDKTKVLNSNEREICQRSPKL